MVPYEGVETLGQGSRGRDDAISGVGRLVGENAELRRGYLRAGIGCELKDCGQVATSEHGLSHSSKLLERLPFMLEVLARFALAGQQPGSLKRFGCLGRQRQHESLLIDVEQAPLCETEPQRAENVGPRTEGHRTHGDSVRLEPRQRGEATT